MTYNTKENYEKFDAMLKEVDEEYRTTLINFTKYKLVMFAMAKLILDNMGSEELAANLFRITQTESRLKRDKVDTEKIKQLKDKN